LTDFAIGSARIGSCHPTYFIADISANHDGSLDRAKQLIDLAAEAGANAAKFQNFRAPKIVSAVGFEHVGRQLSHQATWKKTVFEVYTAASIPWSWTPLLKAHCDAVGIQYLSTPYDFEAVEMLDPWVPAFKIGSGDITWPEMLACAASKGKPVLIACGASDIADVGRAVDQLRRASVPICLMQCNTNYTGSPDNFRHTHLRVLTGFAALFPDLALGLSDHTPGHAVVLGAVALGARVVEKHFTDDTRREGPDHLFSMTPTSWREMVERTRELEAALGDPFKRVAENEAETSIVQRRCLRAARLIKAHEAITRDMIEALRPAPVGSLPPFEMDRILGRTVGRDVAYGEALSWSHVDETR
jgi:N-acetylneuraminate synthase